MRKAAFVSLILGFGLTGLVALPVACGSSAAHPGSLVTDSDGGLEIAKDGSSSGSVDTGTDSPPPPPPLDGGPTTVSITAGDGGTANDISFGDTGLVNCGSAAVSVPVSITNTGKFALTWTAALSAGATHFTLSPVSGAVSPGGTSTLQIIPNAIPSVSAVTTDLYGGVVTIQTSASNDTTHVIQLHQTARGVILNSTLGSALAFGSQAVSLTANSPYSLTNTGNIPATVNLAVGAAPIFGVLPPSGANSIPFVIAANGTAAPTITFSPSALQSYADTMVTTLVGPAVGTCGPLPPNVTLSGSGNNTVLLSPTNLDFGTTNCGTTAAFQQVLLTNKGAQITFTTALAKGANSPFVVTNAPAGNTVPPNGIMTFTITPKTVPKPSSTLANGFGDTLTITTNDGTPSIHNITLNQTARGAILQFTPLAIATVGLGGASQFAAFTVVNAGNYQGTYKLGNGTAAGAVTQTTGGAGTWSSNLFAGNLVGGASSAGILTVVDPPAAQQFLGHVTLLIEPNAVGDTILCADPPPDLELSATGQ
jgi:hypothetical protein